ncbi:MAG: DUF2341 domain-containing protein, partial [Vicinamibacteria bacterium]
MKFAKKSLLRTASVVLTLWVAVAFFCPVPAHAQIGGSLVTSITDSTDLTAYPFLSATYSNNVLYIAFTSTSCASGQNCGIGVDIAPPVTSVSGAGLTFTEIGTAGGLVYSSNGRRVQAWRALAASGAGTGVVTVSLGGTNISAGMGAAMIAFTGTKTTGTNGADAVVQWPSIDGGTGITTLTVPMSAFANPSNRPVAFFSHRAQEATTHDTAAGYTELYDGNHAAVAMGYMAEWHNTVAENAPSATWGTSSAGAGFALELAAASFDYRRALTIDFTKVTPCSGNLTNFPVLVSLSGNWLKTTANGGNIRNSNGYDIAFKASDGTHLDHEIEKYDGTATGGTLVAWVRVPTLSNTANTTIYIYYGHTGISSDLSIPTAVWDSNFLAVWHLKEDPSGTAPQMRNSKSASFHGTSFGTMVSGNQVAGKIDGSLDFDGTDDRIQVGTIVGNSSAFTVSAWFKTSSDATTPDKIWAEGNSGNNNPLTYLSANENGTAGNVRFGVRDDASVAGDVDHNGSWNNNQWHHVVGVQSAKNARELFVDGVTRATNTATVGTVTLNTGNIGAVNRTTIIHYFPDGVDEVRISNTTRSACWVGTEYNSHNGPGNEGSPDFYSVGAAESLTTDVTVSASGTQTASMLIPSTNQYVGGKFVIVDNTGSRNVTGITITESGTVNGQTNLDNIKLFYELDTSAPYDGASESYAGTESQFGSTDTDGFSAGNGTSAFTGTVGISTTATMVVYVVFDVGAGAANGETVEIGTANASTDVTVSAGTVGPASAVDIPGTTTLSVPDVTVSASGTQTASMIIPSTNRYVGGKFVIVNNTGSRNVTGITVTESGTVNGQTNLDNIKLYYEL